MLELSHQVLNYPLHIIIILMGEDLQVTIYGGIKPHLGACSIISPTQPLHTTVFPTHQDHYVTEMYAQRLFETFQCAVQVSCGIHYDQASAEDIHLIMQNMKEMLDQCVQLIKENRK